MYASAKTTNALLRYGGACDSGMTLHVLKVSDYLAMQAMTGSKLLKNNTEGLLGVYNENKADDLTAPDGSTLDIDTATESEIYHNFGELCKLIN